MYLYSLRLAKLLTAVALYTLALINVSLLIFYRDYLLRTGARTLSAADAFTIIQYAQSMFGHIPEHLPLSELYIAFERTVKLDSD